MTTLAVSKERRVVRTYNIRTLRSKSGRKDRVIQAGEVFVVSKKFASTGMGTHGNPCLQLRDTNTRTLLVEEKYFDVFETSTDINRQMYESGWDDGLNCKKCGESGRCECKHKTNQKYLQSLVEAREK
jgi:hypothetical protein